MVRSPRITVLDSPFLFRYVSENEFEFVRRNGFVFSLNPVGTYYTTLLTNDPADAQRYLALSYKPRFRVGGFPLSDPLVQLQVVFVGYVAPKYGQPGGAREYVLKGPLFVLSKPYVYAYDMVNDEVVRIVCARCV